jgi:hypothetical protein
MRRKPFILLALSLLLPIACEAADSTTQTSFPKDLTYKGQPIDPLCLFQPNKKNAVVSLKKCGVSAQKDRHRSGASAELLANNYVGYDYNLTNSPDTEATHGYSYYKIIGKVADSYITYSLNSDNGNGEFSSLNLVNANKNSLKFSMIAGGDQCNNGIYDVKKENNKLIYSVNLTTVDFLKLANNSSLNTNTYKELESCPTCCAASAIFERDLKNTLGKEKLVSINLNGYQQEMALDSQKKYQACFDKIASSYIKNGKHTLTASDLQSFSQDFSSECTKA